MSLCVLNDREGLVEPHRLVVQGRCGERRQIMTFNIRTGVGNQSKTSGVRFGKAVQRKRSNRLHYLILGFTCNAFMIHAAPQFYFDFLHARFGSFEAKCTPQFFSFTT